VSKSQSVAIPTSESDALANAPDPERWLFIDAASTFGGHEVMLLRWLEELSQHRISAFLLARRGSQLRREGVRHAVVVELSAAGKGRAARLIGALRDAMTLMRTAWRLKPAYCVVAEGCLLAQPLFVVLARLIGLRVLVYVPMLQTSASMGFGNGRLRDALVRHFYSKLPHAWVTITREQAHDFRQWAAVTQPIFVLENTVSRAIETAGAATVRDFGEANTQGRLRVIVLGRLEAHQKGLDLLLDHLCAHSELGRRLELSFVGNGPYESEIAQRLRLDASLARWVDLRPWSPTTDALRRSDVLLMTSRYEGVPLVMLEAMALGVPVIAPDFPGTREFIAPDYLFPAGDMRSAFERLERLENPEVRRQVSVHNREKFCARASNEAFTASVRTLTQQIRALNRGRKQSVA
jgi:glycosyltransferase involved in cell wall biosynthesis